MRDSITTESVFLGNEAAAKIHVASDTRLGYDARGERDVFQVNPLIAESILDERQLLHDKVAGMRPLQPVLPGALQHFVDRFGPKILRQGDMRMIGERFLERDAAGVQRIMHGLQSEMTGFDRDVDDARFLEYLNVAEFDENRRKLLQVVPQFANRVVGGALNRPGRQNREVSPRFAIGN